jgi:hypothetical protein
MFRTKQEHKQGGATEFRGRVRSAFFPWQACDRLFDQETGFLWRNQL